jgi:hypothetical protein
VSRRGRKPGYEHRKETKEQMSEKASWPRLNPEPPPEPETEERRVGALLDEVYEVYADMHIQHVSYASGGMHMVEQIRRWIYGYSPHEYPRRIKDVSLENLEAIIELSGSRAFDDNDFHEGMSDALDLMADKVKEKMNDNKRR